MSDILAPVAEVRGESAYNQPASFGLRALSWLTDLTWALALAVLLASRLTWDPSRRFSVIGLTLFSVLILAPALKIAQRLLFARTLGEWIWGLALLDAQKKVFSLASHEGVIRGYRQSRLHRRKRPTAAGMIASFALSAACAAGLFTATGALMGNDPLTLPAEKTELAPFAPRTDAAAEWNVLSFFYTVGAWPKAFEGHPVFYGLPYEQGPPVQFVGKVIARWEAPDIELVIEGPKSPVPRYKPADARFCLSSSPALDATAWISCLDARENILRRHVFEMKQKLAGAPARWTLRWFEATRKPDADPGSVEEQTQGFYLSARTARETLERYVLITGSGTNEAFILARPNTPSGEKAGALLAQSISSLRVSSQIDPGRAWIERALEAVHMNRLPPESDSAAYVAKLAEIQSLLIARISVDPRGYDAYYHLGGTAALLARHLAKLRTAKQNSLPADLETASAAQPQIIQSAYRYAQDISAQDRRNAELAQLWMESKKY